MRRRFWILTVLLCLVAAAVTLAVVKLPRTVPLSRCSEVYRQYADTPGIKATFIQDKQINDSVTIKVTIIEATDSTGWALMKKEFHIKPLPEEVMKLILEGTPMVTKWYAPKGQYNKPMDPIELNNDFLVYYIQKQKVFIFHIESEEQLSAIISFSLEELTI